MNPLYLLRHGPTDVHGAPLGWRDDPVTPVAWARWPAVKAAVLALAPVCVLSSDLRRSRDLAADLGLPHQVLTSLREQGFGAWDAVPWSDNPDAALIYADPVRAVPPGGESFAGCAARAITGLVMALESRPTLVVAHAGSLRAIVGAFLGLPLERSLDLAWDPFGLSCLDVYAPGRGVLRFHNRMVG